MSVCSRKYFYLLVLQCTQQKLMLSSNQGFLCIVILKMRCSMSDYHKNGCLISKTNQQNGYNFYSER